MSDSCKTTGDDQPAGALGDEVYVKIIDKLRELGIAEMVSLPQLVVVGDQSSGKSSVLESLTGFAFPRAPGLCTRYVTQITCRRDDISGTDISIIPGPNSSDERIEALGLFKRSLLPGGLNLADVFLEANEIMGIRMGDGEDDENASLKTFSEDILKIEISGPQQQHLTVIDVPGIFRTATEGLTTESDIELVKNMVTKYIKDSRTIILAVIPCNQDIATQEILKLAKEVDPEGIRTMGVLTKPDLVPERSMQQMVCDLVQGRRQTLRLGYYVVKNRGSDDHDWSKSKRNMEEVNFFAKSPWTTLQSTGRVGTLALSVALSRLLRGLTKKEFKNVAMEIRKLLDHSLKENEALGPGRSDAASQRQYLGKISTDFQQMARCARQADYNHDSFSTGKDLRLITIIRHLNDDFKKSCWDSGHTWIFEGAKKSTTPTDYKSDGEDCPFELHDILEEFDFECPDPDDGEDLMFHIEKIHKNSRGPEIGTFNTHILGAVFREQSSKWQPLVLRHTSRAIVAVHKFLLTALEELCVDDAVREQIWSLLLREKLHATYERAMAHALFLLEVERGGVPATVDDSFEAKVLEYRSARTEETLGNAIADYDSGPWPTTKEQLKQNVNKTIDSQCNVRNEIHDVLRSYYTVAMGRIIDSVCQQVVFHFLLNGKGSPLSIFCPELIMSLSDVQLAAIASEDELVFEKRERLGREIEKLRKAVDELRFVV
ncbi:interferon-induced GTP-binding protein Mx1 [Plectosphaerella plurivora]|uniref:Interferon-induced GTP-binding protein Mx1 n=1 Tax=Plectosphaerella plurivora TaxID=936078 RepID=A0A9P9AAT5_9PEZI|nr:interferon-induced GTP-binding protein Mx1 [Plectosphaerella plurivora]